MLSTPGGSRSPISSAHSMIEAGVCSAGFSTTQLPAASAGASFQHGHQEREVPGNDLADDAERLVEVIGDGVVVDLGDAAFLGADRAGEIAEMVDGERHVGGRRLADRLAVVPGLGERQQVEILLHAVGDPVEDQRALGGAGAAPGVLGRVRGVERGLDVLGVRAGDLADGWPVIGEMLSKYLPGLRRDPFAADEVVVALGEGDLAVRENSTLFMASSRKRRRGMRRFGGQIWRGIGRLVSPARSTEARTVADLRQSGADKRQCGAAELEAARASGARWRG